MSLEVWLHLLFCIWYHQNMFVISFSVVFGYIDYQYGKLVRVATICLLAAYLLNIPLLKNPTCCCQSSVHTNCERTAIHDQWVLHLWFSVQLKALSPPQSAVALHLSFFRSCFPIPNVGIFLFRRTEHFTPWRDRHGFRARRVIFCPKAGVITVSGTSNSVLLSSDQVNMYLNISCLEITRKDKLHVFLPYVPGRICSIPGPSFCWYRETWLCWKKEFCWHNLQSVVADKLNTYYDY